MSTGEGDRERVLYKFWISIGLEITTEGHRRLREDCAPSFNDKWIWIDHKKIEAKTRFCINFVSELNKIRQPENKEAHERMLHRLLMISEEETATREGRRHYGILCRFCASNICAINEHTRGKEAKRPIQDCTSISEKQLKWPMATATRGKRTTKHDFVSFLEKNVIRYDQRRRKEATISFCIHSWWKAI